VERLGLADGLPIIPPTPERVEAMCAAAAMVPDEVVAAIPPTMGVATVAKIAVNAVMAGCRPDYMPYVIAAVRAFAEPAFNGRIVQATSNPAGVMLIVNGPGRADVGLSWGANCLGQGSRANLTIGRAVRLVLVNVGGAAIGTVDKASHGFPGKVSFCFAEDEAASPWSPLHVERGYEPADDVVTVAAAHGTSNIVLHGRPVADDLLRELSAGMIQAGASNYAQGGIGTPVLVMTPRQATELAGQGWTKSAVRAYLHQHARVPLEWYPPNARRSGDLDAIAVDGGVPISESPDDILLVVAGSPGTHATFIPTYGDSLATSARVAR
jgi:hypothetical protein